MEDNINVQISEFPQIRESGSIYVDKTGYFSRLVKPRPSGSRVFFLARPRRFGKSLMISTLKAIFQGKRELFEGLAISKTDYDWQFYPVLHFDLSMATGETFESFMGGFRTAVWAARLSSSASPSTRANANSNPSPTRISLRKRKAHLHDARVHIVKVAAECAILGGN